MVKSKVTVSLLLGFLLLSVLLPISVGDIILTEVDSIWAFNPPDLDGVVSTGEWDIASQAGVTDMLNIRIQNDGEWLYILLDIQGDTVNDSLNIVDGDWFFITFDVNKDGLPTEDVDITYVPEPGEELGLSLWKYSNTTGLFTDGPYQTVSRVGEGFGSSLHRETPHRFWEIAISLNETCVQSDVHIGFEVKSKTPDFRDSYPWGWWEVTFDFSRLLVIHLLEPVESVYTFTPPTIDGNATAEEWQNATLVGEDWDKGIIMFQNDYDYLYILMDIQADTIDDGIPSDSFNVWFDSNRNYQMDWSGGHDIWYGIDYYTGILEMWWGDSPSLTTNSTLGVGFGPSLHNATDHRIWELAIDLKEIYSTATQGLNDIVVVSFSVYSSTPSFWGDYPPGSGGEVADLTKALHIHLVEGGIINGTVTDAETGEPVEGANVTANPTTITGPDGTYSLVVIPGTYNLTVTKAGYFNVTVSMTVEPGLTYIQDFNIVKISYINGTVIDADTGEPVEGANITVNGEQTVTNVNGTYSLNIIFGDYNLTVTKEGYFTNTTTVTAVSWETQTINFTISKIATINGTVIDAETEEPIVGANITANGAQTTTGSDGTYELNVTAGTYDLMVTKEGYFSNSTQVNAISWVTQTLNITLTKIATINGTVIDADTQEPIAGVDITVNGKHITTGPDGSYTFNVTAGNYTINVTKEGYFSDSKQVTAIAWQTQTTDFSIIKYCIITGFVTDSETGEPLEAATVTANGYQNTTATDGTYSFIIEAGTYTLNATKDGYYWSSTSVTVNPGDIHTANFTIIELATITGTVFDETTGEPVAGATVTANPTTITGPQGTYSMSVLPGTYTITVTKGGYVISSTQATVGSGETHEAVFLIVKLGTITGVVIDKKTGDPIVGATIIVNGNQTTTGSDGSYSLKLPPKDYTLTISKEGYENGTAQVVLGAGATETKNIVLVTPAGLPIIPIVAGIGGVAAVAAVILLMKRKPKEKVPRPTMLRIHADPTELLSDGKSTSTITIELLDDEGNSIQALENMEIRLSTNLGRITSPITILKGEATGKATLTSSTEFGKVTLTAVGRGLKRATTSLEFVEKKRYCMHCGTRMSLEDNLCPKCGRAPPSGVDVKVCPNCGEVIPTVAKFCNACGAKQPTETQETS